MRRLTTREEIREALDEHDIIFFDLETNGLERDTDILEIGAVKYRASQLREGNLVPHETFHHLIYFDGTPNWEAFNINRLDPDELKNEGRYLSTVLSEFKEFSDKAVIAGQNIIRFDLPIIAHHSKKHHIDFEPSLVVDTVPLARQYLNVPSYHLADLARYLFLTHRPSHRAIDDVLATAELLSRLVYHEHRASQPPLSNI